MGFPEGRKLAKDVNKNSDECTERLSSLLEQTGLKLDMANRTLEGIAGEEDRHIYIPSETNKLCALQSEAYTWDRNYKQTIICDNSFSAQYDGKVFLRINFKKETDQVASKLEISYKVTQIYPQQTVILNGSFTQDAFAAGEWYHRFIEFSVMKGAIYTVEFTAYDTWIGIGNHFNGGVYMLDSFIFGEIVLREGSSTKYYASVEGAPAIWENNTEVKFSRSMGSTVEISEDILPSFFTPDIDGTVCISFDMTLDSTRSYVRLEITNGTDTWKKSLPAEKSSYPRKVSFDVPVQKDLSYTLRLVVYTGGTGTAYAFSITASNFAVSAVKVNHESTIVVPFVPADETIEIREGDYILKKIPDSIDVQRHHYLVAMADKIYPGDSKAPYSVVFFDIKTMSPDYHVYNDGGSAGDRVALRDGHLEGDKPYTYYIEAVDNEIFLCGHINPTYGETLDALIRNCPVVSATLY